MYVDATMLNGRRKRTGAPDIVGRTMHISLRGCVWPMFACSHDYDLHNDFENHALANVPRGKTIRTRRTRIGCETLLSARPQRCEVVGLINAKGPRIPLRAHDLALSCLPQPMPAGNGKACTVERVGIRKRSCSLCGVSAALRAPKTHGSEEYGCLPRRALFRLRVSGRQRLGLQRRLAAVGRQFYSRSRGDA